MVPQVAVMKALNPFNKLLNFTGVNTVGRRTVWTTSLYYQSMGKLRLPSSLFESISFP